MSLTLHLIRMSLAVSAAQRTRVPRARTPMWERVFNRLYKTLLSPGATVTGYGIAALAAVVLASIVVVVGKFMWTATIMCIRVVNGLHTAGDTVTRVANAASHPFDTLSAVFTYWDAAEDTVDFHTTLAHLTPWQWMQLSVAFLSVPVMLLLYFCCCKAPYSPPSPRPSSSERCRCQGGTTCANCACSKDGKPCGPHCHPSNTKCSNPLGYHCPPAVSDAKDDELRLRLADLDLPSVPRTRPGHSRKKGKSSADTPNNDPNYDPSDSDGDEKVATTDPRPAYLQRIKMLSRQAVA